MVKGLKNWVILSLVFHVWLQLFSSYDLMLQNGYNFEVLYERMGLQELGITFHLGLNGVSSPLFAMAGIVGLGAGLAALHSGAERLHLYLCFACSHAVRIDGPFCEC